MLLARGADVAALVRSEFPDEAETARARAEGWLRVYRADFADFASLKKGFAAVKAGETRLDLLFNNAGAAFDEPRRSARGHEAHFELNTVVPFIVLEELGALLEAGTLKTVVQTSSITLSFVRKFLAGPARKSGQARSHLRCLRGVETGADAVDPPVRVCLAGSRRHASIRLSGRDQDQDDGVSSQSFDEAVVSAAVAPRFRRRPPVFHAAGADKAPGSFLNGPRGRSWNPGSSTRPRWSWPGSRKSMSGNTCRRD